MKKKKPIEGVAWTPVSMLGLIAFTVGINAYVGNSGLTQMLFSVGALGLMAKWMLERQKAFAYSIAWFCGIIAMMSLWDALGTITGEGKPIRHLIEFGFFTFAGATTLMSDDVKTTYTE